MPRLGGHPRGEQVVIINIEVPKQSRNGSKEILEEFAKDKRG